jgi:geranylgeranyl pyrophosphate synthase
MGALHEDVIIRVERAVGERFETGRTILTAAPGIASELTIETCRSLGAEPERAFAAAAAIHASFIAIALIDELLDEDPRGALSVGQTSNLASVAQALAYEFISETEPSARAPAARRIARMLIDTAWGQERDVTETAADGDTWSIAAAKTAPLFEAAVFCGAITAGASEDLADGMERFGGFVGRIVQIQDDLTDALEPGNDSDWRPPISNVALRYALHVDHADRDRVRQLLPSAGVEGDARDQIRRILATCGAIEYGMSSVLFYAGEGRRFLEGQPVEQRYLTEFLDGLTAPTRNVLASLGVSADEMSRHLVEAFTADAAIDSPSDHDRRTSV